MLWGFFSFNSIVFYLLIPSGRDCEALSSDWSARVLRSPLRERVVLISEVIMALTSPVKGKDVSPANIS